MSLKAISIDEIGKWEKRIPRSCVVNRDELILELCRNRSVLHIGAVDSPFHMEKAARGDLLHQKVRAVAASVKGIDADRDAIAWLKAHHGIDDIEEVDLDSITAPYSRSDQKHYDVVLCCDILEHVMNFSSVMSYCRSHMDIQTLLVITTINATSAKVAARALFDREAVHPDHVCYFSYGTICALIRKQGLVPIKFGVFCYSTVTAMSKLFFGILARVAPGSADGLFLISKIPEGK